MKQLVVIPTIPQRSHYLKVCLDHVKRANGDLANVIVGIDRVRLGPAFDEQREIIEKAGALWHLIPEHKTYGNTFAVLTLLKHVYDGIRGWQPDIVHVVEDDVMVKPDAFTWALRMHEEYPDAIAVCGWVCNLEGPIVDEDYLLNWFYAPFSSWRREMLAKFVEHANPEYFQNMRRYVLKTFPNSVLHASGTQTNTKFFEQDAIPQFILERDKLTCVWNRIAHCHHIGAHGYNRPNGPVFEGTLDERVTKVETLLANPHLRAQMFGRAIVEREIGGPIPERKFGYRITLPGGWQSEIVSELEAADLPRRLNSSDCQGATVERI